MEMSYAGQGWFFFSCVVRNSLLFLPLFYVLGFCIERCGDWSLTVNGCACMCVCMCNVCV